MKSQAFGQVLLLLLGIGLACHAAWRLLMSIIGPSRARGWRRTADRVSMASGGLMSGFLAINAFQAMRGGARGRSWIHALLRSELGTWLIILVGAGMIASGLYQLYRAYSASFRENLRLHEMSPRERTWAIRIGRFGIAARGVVLPIAGWLFIQAGRHAGGRRAPGTEQALREIFAQRWGEILLAIVAAGFVAYALYEAINARYRRTYA